MDSHYDANFYHNHSRWIFQLYNGNAHIIVSIFVLQQSLVIEANRCVSILTGSL